MGFVLGLSLSYNAILNLACVQAIALRSWTEKGFPPSPPPLKKPETPSPRACSKAILTLTFQQLVSRTEVRQQIISGSPDDYDRW